MKKSVIIVFIFMVSLLFADKAEVYISQKNFGMAEQELLNMLFKSPNDIDVRLRLAYVQLWQHKYPEAEANFLKVLEKAPDYQDAIDGLKKCYQWSGKINKRIKLLENKQSLESYIELNSLYYSLGNFVKSEKYAKKAISKGAQRKSLNRKELYSIDVGYRYYNLTYTKDWNHFYTYLYYYPFYNFSIGLKNELHNRYSMKDDFFGFELSYKPNKKWAFVLENMGCLSPNFLPQIRIKPDIYYKPFNKPFVFFLGGLFSKYKNNRIRALTLGGEYYFPYKIYSGYKYTMTYDKLDNFANTQESFVEIGQYYNFKFKFSYIRSGEFVINEEDNALSYEAKADVFGYKLSHFYKNFETHFEYSHFNDEPSRKRDDYEFGIKIFF